MTPGEVNKPLLEKAKEGNLAEIKRLVETEGADVLAKDENGKTPLQVAAAEEHLEVVKYFVDEYIKRGLYDFRTNAGSTLLHFAALGGDINQVKHLVEKGANVNAENKHGNTPLHLAAKNGHLNVVEYLVENGADINAKNKYGETPCDVTHSEEIKRAMGCDTFWRLLSKLFGI